MPDTTRSSPIRGLSRRDFVKYCSYLATLIGMDAYAVPEIASALEEAAKKPPVVWTNFQACTGCTVALLQSTAPDPAVLLLQQISLGFMETAMAATGSGAEKSLEQTLEEGAYWVGEGSVANGMPGAMTAGGKTSQEIAKEVYSKAKGAIAIGSCATFGNCQASKPNPTGAMGIGAYLKGPGGIPDAAVVNLPRCPGHPEDLVATLTYILVNAKLPELDAQGRPTFLYGQLIHDTCERRGHFEAGEFVESFGDEGSAKKWCLYKVGCKGPVTHAPCGINRWNGRTSWCVAAGGPCTGCAEDNYWDDFQPFNQEVPNIPMAGVAGVPISTIGWGLAGLTAAGLGVHFIGQAVSGRLFKGGPPADTGSTTKGGEA
ncbi:MAG: hydrogenase small subunit [Coriobacteriales bacterium]|nr:hydrogenase small subunit [Coriobacteriales bacterium]